MCSRLALASTSSSDAAANPAISSITPTSGPAAGGALVTILGRSFSSASAVSFGNRRRAREAKQRLRGERSRSCISVS